MLVLQSAGRELMIFTRISVYSFAFGVRTVPCGPAMVETRTRPLFILVKRSLPGAGVAQGTGWSPVGNSVC